mgnify:FL=1
MKTTLFTLCCLLISVFGFAQVDQEPEMPAGGKIDVKSNTIYGKIVEDNSKKGIPAASVQLFVKKANGTDTLVAGMLTQNNGDFKFANLQQDSVFRILVSAIGYEPYEQTITVSSKGNQRFFLSDLGNIALIQEVQQLGGVTVTANRPALEMGIDRKVFNASKSLVASGGTAIDLMKNIPSVSVDLEGNVQLRNSSPQIFVDGRPTILTLDQIPAENIDKIELITNPSAKFDAASSGGIINIVLKKNKRMGLNGVASAGIGWPKILNGNLSLNLREGKFNFFLNGGFNQSGGEAKGETERQNKSGGVIQNYFNQTSVNDRTRRFGNGRFGIDYFMTNRSTISLSQQIGGGTMRSDENQYQENLDNSKAMIYYGERLSDYRNRMNRNGTALNFKHTFPKEGRELTADVSYNYGNNRGGSNILNNYYNPDGTAYQPSSLVRNDNRGSNRQLTVQTDFVNPITEDIKLEGGLRSFTNWFKSKYDAFGVNGNTETKLPLSNNYEYTENVYAGYLTYSQKIKTFSYQAGLRAEYSKFNGLLVDSAQKFGYEYPSKFKNIWNALFPSLFLTKELNEKAQIQANYSRRIRRPNFWNINPFVDISDPVNLRQGNPALRPEFINSFEVNYSQNYKGGNFLAVLYMRNNPDDIMQYSDTISAQQYDQLKNAGVDPNAILNTYINAGVTNRYGAEFTVQHKFTENFDITPTVNLQYRTVKANVNEQDLSNEGFNWDAKLIANYKLVTPRNKVLNNLGFQLTGEFESAQVIAQGKEKAQYGFDFAMKKDFLKNNRATVTFAVNDVLNSYRWGTIYDTENFYQDSYRRWNVRSFRLTFSYKFGDSNFSFTNNRRNGGGGDEG